MVNDTGDGLRSRSTIRIGTGPNEVSGIDVEMPSTVTRHGPPLRLFPCSVNHANALRFSIPVFQTDVLIPSTAAHVLAARSPGDNVRRRLSAALLASPTFKLMLLFGIDLILGIATSHLIPEDGVRVIGLQDVSPSEDFLQCPNHNHRIYT